MRQEFLNKQLDAVGYDRDKLIRLTQELDKAHAARMLEMCNA